MDKYVSVIGDMAVTENIMKTMAAHCKSKCKMLIKSPE